MLTNSENLRTGLFMDYDSQHNRHHLHSSFDPLRQSRHHLHSLFDPLRHYRNALQAVYRCRQPSRASPPTTFTVGVTNHVINNVTSKSNKSNKSKSFLVDDILSAGFGEQHRDDPTAVRRRNATDSATGVVVSGDPLRGGCGIDDHFGQRLLADVNASNAFFRGYNDAMNNKRKYNGDSETETAKFPRSFHNSEGANAIDCLRRLSASIGDYRASPYLDFKREKLADFSDAKSSNYGDDSRSGSSCSAHSSVSSNRTPPISNNYAIGSSLSPPSKCDHVHPSRTDVSNGIKKSFDHGNARDNDTPTSEDPTNPVSRSGSTPPQSKNFEQSKFWPAWVYCTRYSDRPSSGPRSRKPKKNAKSLKSDGTNGDSKRPVSPSTDDKRPRTAFNSVQLAVLRKEFETCQYLTEQRRNQLSSNLGLQEYQVKIWFQNKRAKLKKTRGVRNRLAIELMAQGLYNHSTSEKDQNSS